MSAAAQATPGDLPAPPPSLRVVLDRGSVCMGDDTVSHGVSLTLPADLPVADLLARHVLGMLPTVEGDVAWRITCGDYRVEPTSDGAFYLSEGPGSKAVLAELRIDCRRAPAVRGVAPVATIGELPRNDHGELAVRATYYSSGVIGRS